MGFRGSPPRIYTIDVATGRGGVLGDFPGMTFAPRFAPDGRSLLLTLAQNGNSDIYLWDIASRRATRLTNDAAIDTSPSFSPDGSRIVFNSDRGGRPLLYVMGRGGGGAARISFGEGRYGSPAWSPRGDLIAFMVIKGGMFSIGVMRPDGSDERLITRSNLDESPTWAPERPGDHVQPADRQSQTPVHHRCQRLQRARGVDTHGRVGPRLVAAAALNG